MGITVNLIISMLLSNQHIILIHHHIWVEKVSGIGAEIFHPR